MKHLHYVLPLFLSVSCSEASDFKGQVANKEIAARAETPAPTADAVPVALEPAPAVAESPVAEAPVVVKEAMEVLAPAETLVFPGTKVSRVGINFEDWKLNDDFNDAVLRFSGLFDVTADGKIRSIVKQEVEVDRFNGSSIYHDLTVTLTRLDGSIHSETMPVFGATSRSAPPVRTMLFEKGDYLDVTMINHNDPTNKGAWKSMNSEWAKVLLDKCNNSGT